MIVVDHVFCLFSNHSVFNTFPVMSSSKRLESFDLLRLFFVLLALISHFRISQGAGYELDKLSLQKKLSIFHLPYHIALTRSSMPALLIIFGFMIEYVYAKVWKEKGGAVVLEKMMTRTIVCYLAFITLAGLAIFTQGGGAPKTYLGTMLFIYNEEGKAFLFKYYTFLIPFVFILMWVRFRYNVLVEVLLVAGLIAIAEIVKGKFSVLPHPFTHLGENLFGIGNKIGPSVIHSLLLITFGGLTANYIRVKNRDGRTCLLYVLVLASIIAVGAEMQKLGFAKFIVIMASTRTYRAHNSYVYFAFGIISFLLFWVVSWLISKRLGDRVKEIISYYGGNTFIIFLYGNIILLFFPKINTTGVSYLFWIVVFLAMSLGCVNLYYWLNQKSFLVKKYNKAVRAIAPNTLRIASKVAQIKAKEVRTHLIEVNSTSTLDK